MKRDPEAQEKRCTKCGEMKPLSAFDKNRDGRPYLHSACRTCRSAAAYQWWLDNKDRAADTRRRRELAGYGMTVEEYDDLLARQDGHCGICEAVDAGADHKRLPVDHDHATGRVRGLLCHRCNRALGLLGDDIDLLRKAIKYLEGAESN